MGIGAMKVHFIGGSFTSVSETVIMNEVRGVINRGHVVGMYSFVSYDTSKIHAAV